MVACSADVQNRDDEDKRLVAVASLLHQSSLAIVTTLASGIDRPSKLDGKKIACLAPRSLEEIIKHDGGQGICALAQRLLRAVWFVISCLRSARANQQAPMSIS